MAEIIEPMAAEQDMRESIDADPELAGVLRDRRSAA